MRYICHFLVVVCMVTFSLFSNALGQENDLSSKLFSRANTAYTEGRYQEAVSLYEKIVDDHGFSAALLYNLGNSYAKSGKYGKAIVNYERALLVSVLNADIITNLQLIRQQTAKKDMPPRFFQKLSRYIAFNHWLIITLLSVAGLLFFTFSPFHISLAKVTKITSTVCSIAVICVSSAGLVVTHRDHSVAVVIEENAHLQVSPFLGSKSRGNADEGLMVNSLRYHKGYYLVEDTRGRNGWVPESSIEFIIPTDKL